MENSIPKKEIKKHENSKQDKLSDNSEENQTKEARIDSELSNLENVVKKAITKLNNENYNETGLFTELSNLENVVKKAITELADLENNIEEIFNPTSGTQINQESNYIMAVRRFQNAMKIALVDGATEKDLKTFEEGFNFYKSALEMLIATGNEDEIEQHKSEFAQVLVSILTKSKNVEDPEYIPFLFKTCRSLAEIYDSFSQFKTALKFHNRAGDLMADNILLADFEYFQVVLDYLLLDNKVNAEKYVAKLKLKHFKAIANELIVGFKEKKANLIEKVQTKIEVLCAQRKIETSNISYLFRLVKIIIIETKEETPFEKLEVSSDTVPLSNEKVEEIKASLSQGIQRLQEAHPNIQIPIAAQIDTATLVSEITQAISSEISKEIKSLSDNIVSKILSSIPRGGVSSAPARFRSGGTISDEGVPDIEVVEGGPQERPSRPKLDDMINSIIVSE